MYLLLQILIYFLVTRSIEMSHPEDCEVLFRADLLTISLHYKLGHQGAPALHSRQIRSLACLPVNTQDS